MNVTLVMSLLLCATGIVPGLVCAGLGVLAIVSVAALIFGTYTSALLHRLMPGVDDG